MNIVKDTVVTFHYRLSDADGQQLEDSHDQDPVAYLHGHNAMLPGLEAGFDGRAEGDSFSVTLAQPYGPRRAGTVQRVPIKHLASKQKPRVGQPVVVNTDQGPREVMVVKVGRFNIDVDTNHPYAGKVLTYEVDITGVRQATDEELAHGHAHGVGGHQH
ncbi:MAG: peptidylprolyl isomerase [Gammaproteobacteria bacterium]|nr:peptidylprolyl isomerase [Gammaproteobacteria bacterium]